MHLCSESGCEEVAEAKLCYISTVTLKKVKKEDPLCLNHLLYWEVEFSSVGVEFDSVLITPEEV